MLPIFVFPINKRLSLTFEILHLQQAVAAKSFHLPSEEISRGNVSEALKTAQHVLDGGIHIGGQEHFYLETQACLVVPKGEDGEMEVFSATQHPTSIQVIGLYPWWSGVVVSALALINEVNQRRARLLLRWATQGQPSLPSLRGR